MARVVEIPIVIKMTHALGPELSADNVTQLVTEDLEGMDFWFDESNYEVSSVRSAL